MAQSVGEFFVTLGVKGGEKSIKTISDTKSGLKEVASTGWAAKAAIAGVIYGLEEMMRASAARGMGLTQLATMTGVTTDKIQALDDVFRKFGVTSDQIDGSLKNVQKTFTDIAMNKGVSAETRFFWNATNFDTRRLQDHVYWMQKAQEFAHKVKPAIAENILGAQGFDPTLIQGLIRNNSNLETAHRRTGFGAGEVQQQAKVYAAWSELNKSVADAFGHFTAKHGMELTKDIAMLIKPIEHLASAFTKLTANLGAFETLNMIFKGWGEIFDGINSAMDKMNALFGNTEEKGGTNKKRSWGQGTLWMNALNKSEDAVLSGMSALQTAHAVSRQKILSGALPKPPQHSAQGGHTTNVVNSNAYISGVPGAAEARNEHAKHVKHAVHKMPRNKVN